jgi:hypothetical protein
VFYKDGIARNSEVVITGLSQWSNNYLVEVFKAGSNYKLGNSMIHTSCSDPDMNGAEDCGKRAGNGPDNSPSLLNTWIFDGMVDLDQVLDCTP